MAKGDRRRRSRQRAAKAASATVKGQSRKVRRADSEGQRMVDSVVTPEAQAKGDYRYADVKLVEVVEGGEVKAKTGQAVRNFAQSQVERWHAKGLFEEREWAAIQFYQEAHRKVFGGGAKVTASYSPVIVRGAAQAVELWANSTVTAKLSLRLLDMEVFFREGDYFYVWQNVVIFDQPAGISAALLSDRFVREAVEVARVIVKNIAAKVADIVIDSSRSDFGDLLLDLDAPRKGRSRAA